MEKKIVYYEDTKQDHTIETLRLVLNSLNQQKINKLVLASTTGATAAKAMDYFKNQGIQLIVIPHQYGFSDRGNLFPEELVKELRENGHEVHFGTMLFETDKLYGTNTPMIIANYLRCFGEGVKVCFEIALMAADAGLVQNGEKIIAAAGTGKGLDTALVMQAATSNKLSRLRVNEIICKPLNEIR